MCTKEHKPCQVACAKALVACYISPSTHNMGQNVYENMDPKHVWKCQGEKNWGKIEADWGKKNCSNTLVH